MSVLSNFNPSFLPFSMVRDVFIETGTGNGSSLKNALSERFNRYVSIDICERHWLSAIKTFGCTKLNAHDAKLRSWIHHEPTDEITDRNRMLDLSLYLGSGPEVLSDVLDHSRPTTLWLDSHYMGGVNEDEMDPVHGQCPLLHELDAILAVPWKTNPIIAIDDANCFCSDEWWMRYGDDFDRRQWPRFQDIYDRLHTQFTIVIQNYQDGGVLYAY